MNEDVTDRPYTSEELDELFTNKENPEWVDVVPEAAFHSKRTLRHGREFADVLRQQAGLNDGVELAPEDIVGLNDACRRVRDACILVVHANLQASYPKNDNWETQTP